MEGSQARRTDGLQAEMCFRDAFGHGKDGEHISLCSFSAITAGLLSKSHRGGEDKDLQTKEFKGGLSVSSSVVLLHFSMEQDVKCQ